MTNSDLGRLLKADEIQRVLRKPRRVRVRRVLKRNPLKSVRTMLKLNPYASVVKRAALVANLKLKNAKVRYFNSLSLSLSFNSLLLKVAKPAAKVAVKAKK